MSKKNVYITTEENLLNHLLKIEAKDVNLKFIFDHIRNYGICGLMLGIGVKVLLHPDKSNSLSTFFDYLSGGFLFALPWGLFVLNFIHGIYGFLAIRDTKETNIYFYLAGILLIFLLTGKLMLYAALHEIK